MLSRCARLRSIYCYNASHMTTHYKGALSGPPRHDLDALLSITSSEEARDCTIDHGILRLPDKEDTNETLAGQLEDQDLSGIDCNPNLETLPTVGHDWEEKVPYLT